MESTKVARAFKIAIVEKDQGGRPTGRAVAPGNTSSRYRSTCMRAVGSSTGVRVEHVGHAEMVALPRMNASSLFFRGVHEAFACHYRLGLRPEVLLFLIGSVIAETVRRHPETYREIFTRRSRGEGKETLTVRHDGLRRGVSATPWSEVFPGFNAQLRERVSGKVMGAMLPGFSTATPETDAALTVCFMDAASSFYDYRVMTRCGIPEVRLLGTAEDWVKLETSAVELMRIFAEHLGGYFLHLLPVLTTLAEQAGGAPHDESFWQSIYTFKSESGGDRFNGWLVNFVHYIQVDRKLVEKPKVPQGRPREGLAMGSVPANVATVPFVWDYFGEEIPLTFAGGVLDLRNDGGCLTPGLSYAVLDRS